MTTARPPRYRIEHRHPDLSPLIVAFARTESGARAREVLLIARLRRRGEKGELVTVDQDTEKVVTRSVLWPTRQTPHQDG